MAANFIGIIKEIIEEKKLQDLSSDGWSRMRQVQRDLDSKKISADDAVGKFLKERDFSYAVGGDRHAVEKIKKSLK